MLHLPCRLLAPLLLLGGCATTIDAPIGDAPEQPRAERINRGVHSFNRGLDRVAIKPATQVYRAVVPDAARRGVSNAFQTVGTPVSAANAVLQGKVKQAFRQVDRFLINGILGLGLADHATELGRPEEEEDFGQTLAVWGVKSGPFIMLPLLGPSTLRDLAGFGVDIVGDPFPIARDAAIYNYGTLETVGQLGLQTLDLRMRLIESGADGVLADSPDEYVTIRSAYLQRRRSQIYDGSPPDEPGDEEDYEPLPPTPAAAAPQR